jgi:hypothetical protein
MKIEEFCALLIIRGCEVGLNSGLKENCHPSLPLLLYFSRHSLACVYMLRLCIE